LRTVKIEEYLIAEAVKAGVLRTIPIKLQKTQTDGQNTWPRGMEKHAEKQDKNTAN
jgi:hypothetical protein